MSAYYNYDYLKKKESVLKRDKYKCANCGSTDRNDLNVHHIVPLSKGGSNTERNMIVLCSKCHKAIHCGKHRNTFDITRNQKKNTKKTDEEAYALFDNFFSEDFGVAELKNQMGFSKSYKITDCPQFKKYVKEKGIERYRNNVDTILCRHEKIYPGAHVGIVIYNNGVTEPMIYQRDKMIKAEEFEEPVQKKTMTVEDLYEAYLTGEMGFSETDYRIARVDKYAWGDFRKSIGFQHYLSNHDITDYQNNVDMIIRVRGNVAIGDEVGYVIYKDGTRELMIHH